MKKFVLGISDVEIKYRVASQMGFRDVIESLLNGPELPYLKDTVWQSGFNRHHNYLQWEPHITCINNYILFYVSRIVVLKWPNMDCGLIPGKGTIFHFAKYPPQLWGQSALISSGYWVLSVWQSSAGAFYLSSQWIVGISYGSHVLEHEGQFTWPPRPSQLRASNTRLAVGTRDWSPQVNCCNMRMVIIF